jgi:predicted acylesterase/phospholipase RssA
MAKFDMVFEGGGAKGSVFVGALEVLDEVGHTHRRLIGTSAGAITATLVAAGYKPQELLAAVNERLPDGKPRFSAFMDAPVAADFSDEVRNNSETMEALAHIDIPLLPEIWERRADRKLLDHLLEGRAYRHLFSLVECGGFFAGNDFRNWLIEKFVAKGISGDITFADFFKRTGEDLSLVASDTSDVELLVLNHRTAPDLPVAWAVRMSMSIPFVWREVVWQSDWGLYRGRTKTGTVVDGGVLSNFPISLIDIQPSADAEIAAIMGNTDADAAENLGLLIDEALPVLGAADTTRTPLLLGHARTVQRLARLVDTLMGARDNGEIRAHEKEVCRLPAKGYGTTEFDMPQARLDALVEAGRGAMRAHLATRKLGGA